jgi:hypothetical protein
MAFFDTLSTHHLFSDNPENLAMRDVVNDQQLAFLTGEGYAPAPDEAFGVNHLHREALPKPEMIAHKPNDQIIEPTDEVSARTELPNPPTMADALTGRIMPIRHE